MAALRFSHSIHPSFKFDSKACVLHIITYTSHDMHADVVYLPSSVKKVHFTHWSNRFEGKKLFKLAL